MDQEQDLWVVVLAGASGRPGPAPTRCLTHDVIPKPFSWLCPRGSSLPAALTHAESFVSRDRIVAVVAEQQRPVWRRELGQLPAENVLSQPANRGTAAGVLLGLLHVISRQGPDARLLVFSADHRVSDEPLFRRSVQQVLQVEHGGRLVLLGMRPLEFRSFAFVASAATLLCLYGRMLPNLLSAFVTGLPRHGTWAPETLRVLYRRAPTYDLAADLLTRAAPELWVLPVRDCGRPIAELRRAGRPLESRATSPGWGA